MNYSSARLKLASAVVAAMLVLPAPSHAQAREGFTISFGIGGGSASVSCDVCDDLDRETAPTGYLRFGGTPNRTAVVGGELHGWSKELGDVDASVGFLTGFVQWYPSVTSGFFVKGNLGFGSTRFTLDGGDDDGIESSGLAVGVGTGVDIRMGRNFSLSPFLNYLTTVGAEARIGGSDLNQSLDGSLLQFGMGFTWH